MKREQLIAAAPLILFGLLALILIVGLHRGGEVGTAALHVGTAAPATDLPTLNDGGGHFTTRAWQGRPYLVNFFASWCADCRTEHEELMTLAAGHIPVIGIIFKDKPDKAGVYLDKNGNPFIAVARDDNDRAATAWGVASVPETFLIDARGIIRWHHSGALTDALVNDELMPVWEQAAHGD